MTDADDYRAFGDFLSQAKAKINKTLPALEKELGVTSIAKWHYGEVLPKSERLSSIARAYNADLAELTAAYERTKRAREAEKKARIRVTHH